MENILIHLLIGILLVIGFFSYWGKAAGWYKEGGFIYEWWHNRKNKKDEKK